jgi:hypothetical protein
MAHLYPDRRANCITLHHADLNLDLITHEVAHGLSDVRDRWASELLAYAIGFAGADSMPSTHQAALASFEISIEDIVHHGMSNSRLLSQHPTGGAPGLNYEPTDPYAGFLFMMIFERLRRSFGYPALSRYLREVDRIRDDESKEALFARLFGYGREAMVGAIVETLRAGRPPRPTSTPSVPLTERMKSGFEVVQSRWWMDVFDLVYLRTALCVHRPSCFEEREAMLLYIDYRIYRAQRTFGVGNAPLLRTLLKRSLSLAVSPIALSVRYFLLTDHALDHFAGRMGALPKLDAELFSLIHSVLEQLGKVDSDSHVATLALGHFHLFYTRAMGANPSSGQNLLERVLEQDPTCEEAYLHLGLYHARRGNALAVQQCLSDYRLNVGCDIGPNLLARMFENEGDGRDANPCKRR